MIRVFRAWREQSKAEKEFRKEIEAKLLTKVVDAWQSHAFMLGKLKRKQRRIERR